MKVEIMPAEPMHIIGLIERTQFSEVHGAREALRTHILMSEDSWVAKLDGQVVVCWGVIPPSILSSMAYVWVVASNDIGKHPHVKFLFIRYSQRILEIMLQKYESLYGFCFPHESESIKWLRHLGAKFEDPHGGKILFRIRRSK